MIPATLEARAGGWQVGDQPQKLSQDLISIRKKKKKRLGMRLNGRASQGSILNIRTRNEDRGIHLITFS